MTSSDRIVCGAHGETPATFVCRHLLTGVACGYHANAAAPDDPWPDAWCDLCEDAFQAAGGAWTEDNEAVADIGVLCTRCYEAARDRNRAVPPLARGAATRLTEHEADALLHHAVHDAQAAQAASQARRGWGAMARWDYDDGAGTLTFTDPARPTVVADVQLVGSYSTRSSTFQWAWQTLDDDDPQAEVAARVRTFGLVRGIERLTEPTWAADEADGWQMAALARYLVGADALYRAPFDHLCWFMLLDGWRAPPTLTR